MLETSLIDYAKNMHAGLLCAEVTNKSNGTLLKQL